jgi:hypothetical protein
MIKINSKFLSKEDFFLSKRNAMPNVKGHRFAPEHSSEDEAQCSDRQPASA